MFTQYFILVVLSTFALSLTNGDPLLQNYRGHVVKTDGKYEIVAESIDSYKERNVGADVLAVADWNPGYNETGWSVLEVKTYGNQSNVDQAYAAGLIEGYLTRGKIKLFFFKSFAFFFCLINRIN